MKILYVDMQSILYSDSYLEKNDDIREVFESKKYHQSKNSFLENVQPDREGAQRLARVAQNLGLFVYPLGTLYSRDLLIKHEIFSEEQLAPFIDLRLWGAMDDGDPFRIMNTHSRALKAQWFVCGDVFPDDLAKHFPERFLRTRLGSGVTDELIRQIKAIR
ncbi:hypothetical protein [Vibrio crassostreae]|uniref:hypothetical protein n=1 Tax=Vibrio crassostreae TaxID=246167 RepID=UPI001B3028F4|nr:hypothetical protein [Vibrio crassostreae]